MPRIPEITDRNEVAEEVRHHADSIIASRGRIQPPYNVLLHSPDIAARTAHLAGYSIYDSLMPMDVKEIAISTASAQTGLTGICGCDIGKTCRGKMKAGLVARPYPFRLGRLADADLVDFRPVRPTVARLRSANAIRRALGASRTARARPRVGIFA